MSNFKFHNLLPKNFNNVSVESFKLLGFGIKFCPRPAEPVRIIYDSALSLFIRRLKIYDFFHNICDMPGDKSFDSRFKTVSSWIPPQNTDYVLYICKWIKRFGNVCLSKRDSLRPKGPISKNLAKLLANKFIKIVQTDKNLGLCVLSIGQYHVMVLKHLNDLKHYVCIGSSDSLAWIAIFNDLHVLHDQFLSKFIAFYPKKTQIFKFLKESKDSLPKFHVLPKLHKLPSADIATRPIIGAVSWITTRWAIYLCSVLENVVCRFVLKNSIDLIENLEGFPIGESDFLVTADVSSLYTNMSLNRLFDCLKRKNISQFEIEIIQFICNNNFFSYGAKVFKQLDGIAMGFNAAVHCANIYLDSFDLQFAPFCVYYGRYIDDIFLIFRGSQLNLQELIKAMNCFIEDIDLTFTFSTLKVDFLDLSVFKHNDSICFNTFQKPMNIYQFLPPFSFHSPACISGYIKGEITRFIRTNTLLNDRRFFIDRFRERLLARGFSKNYLFKIFSSISIHNRSLDKKINRTSKNLIPLVVPFYPNEITKQLRILVRDLNTKFTFCDENLEFILSFRRNRNLFQLCSRSGISPDQEQVLRDKGLQMFDA